MTKLSKKGWHVNEALEGRRRLLSGLADVVFAEVMAAPKEGREHSWMLGKFNRINRRTQALLEKHSWYFNQKRAHILRNGEMARMLFSGVIK